MSDDIPFLQFSPEAQLEILNQMSTADFLNFSLLSQRTKNIAKEANRSIPCLELTYGEDDESSNTVALQGCDVIIPGDEDCRDWGMDIMQTKGYCERINLEDSRDLVVERQGNTLIVLESSELRESLMDKLARHIFSVFRVSRYKSNVRLAAGDGNLFMFKCSRAMTYENETTTQIAGAENLNFSMNHLELELLPGDTEVEVFSMTMFNQDLEFNQDPWLTIENLRNMSRVQLKITEASFLNQMIKSWIQGRFFVLEFFEAKFNGDHAEILKDVVTFESSDHEQNWEEDDVSGCLNIRQEDGTMASIKLDGNHFKFYVWP